MKSLNILVLLMYALVLLFPLSVSADDTQIYVAMETLDREHGYFYQPTVTVSPSLQSHYSIGQEVVERRTESSKSVYLGLDKNGNERYGTTFYTGIVHYKDNYANPYEQWKDIDLTPVNGVVLKAPYILKIDGAKVTVTDKKTGSIVEMELTDIGENKIAKPSLSQSKGKAIKSNIDIDTDLEITWSNSQVRLTRVLKSANASPTAKFKVTQSGKGLNVDYSASDNGKKGIPVSVSKVGDVLTETIDVTGKEFPIRVDPTISIPSTAADGHVVSSNVNYATAQGASSGTSIDNTSVFIVIDNRLYYDTYNVHRGFLYFDTSSLGATAAIVSATVTVYVAADQWELNAGHSDLRLYEGTQSDSLALADFDAFGVTALSADFTNWNYAMAVGNHTITLNSDGRAVINKTGTTKFCLRITGDIAASIPSGPNDVVIYSSEQYVGYQPALYIDYTVLTPPALTTTAASSVEETTSTTGGNCTDVGTYSVTVYGTQYGTTGGYGSWVNTTTTQAVPFTWSDSLSSLTQGELYYFRAFAYNAAGTSYGAQATFLTKPSAPTSFNVYSINTTTIGTTWVAGTGALNTYIRYKDGSYPTSVTDGTLSYNGTALANNQTGLTSGHTYYFRAWSWASEGGLQQYSDDYAQGYAIAADPPVVASLAATLVEETTATGNGNVTSLGGGGNITTYGIQYGTSTGVYGATASTVGSIGVGTFTQALTSLTRGELYYFRAFGTSTSGTGYGSELTFFTKPNDPSGLVCSTASETQINLSWSKGSGADNTVIKYAAGAYPATVNDGTLAYNSTGTSTSVSALTPGLTYYFRAWSWAYESTSASFSDSYSQCYSTTGAIPTLTTDAAQFITSTTASIGGTITSIGGVAPTHRGVQYGTASGVYTTTVIESGGPYGIGSFTEPVTGLTSGTAYYFRAFANNTFGYGYGIERSFLTSVAGSESANFTSVVPYCIYQNQMDAQWYQSTPNYVGCVNGCNYTKYGIGVRFTGVTIPAGAEISSAYLVVTSDGNYDMDTVSSEIRAEDASNPTAFVSVADFRGRDMTSAVTTWMGISHWYSDREYYSPDISDVLQEVIDRSGWASGNAMIIFWHDFFQYSSQSCFMSPTIRGGNTYKLVVTYIPGAGLAPPEMLTKDASSIGSTTATLNGYIFDDNGAEVMVRFGYGNTSQTDFDSYPTITSWSTANYSTGEAFYESITGLTASMTYYFNVQGVNSVGNATGSELTFTTSAASTTVSPSSFILIPYETHNELQWVRPAGYSQSVVRYSIGAIPADDGTGTLLYQGTDSFYTHTSLSSGTTYGYRVWGYEDGTLSTSTTGIITTKGTASSTPLGTPESPLNWFIATDYTYQNTTFYYEIVNNLADSFHVPRDTAWVTWALAVSMFIGFLIWSASRSMVATTIAVMIGIIIGAAQHLLPVYMAFLVAVFGISIIAVRERI